MGRLLPLRSKLVSSASTKVALLFVVAVFAATVFLPTPQAYAFGEQYGWEDKETIDGHGGNLGPASRFFTKSGGLYYGGTDVIDMYIANEPVTTPDSCFVLLGIQVDSSNARGTLRRVKDIGDGTSNACPANYDLKKAFDTTLRLTSTDKSSSNPSSRIQLTVRTLVSKDEDYPATTDTITIRDATTSKVIVKRTVDKTNAYSDSDWKGFERKFNITSSIGSDKRYEACSQALDLCETMTGLSLISAPLGVSEIEIKKPPTEPVVCSAGALGWVFCPLAEFMTDAISNIAGFLESFLTYDPLLGSQQGKAIRAIWGIILVIANVGLIFTFLAVAFSQATSIGISSYGVKKLFPRIIAAAVLINLSFFICAAAVDIANIVGVSVKGVVDTGLNAVANNQAGDASVGYGPTTSQKVIGLLGLAIAFGTGAIFLLLPVLLSAITAVFTAFLILAAREVLITLLIIVSPLAFLAWILPNTESWFTKWRKLFTAMLMMFPLVMLVFYGSLLVSSMIVATHTNNSGSGNIEDFMVSLLSFAVLVIPLFSLPFIMKSAGGVLDRLGVLVNNRNRGIIDRSRKKAQELKGNTTYQHGRELRKRASNEFRDTKFANRVGKGGVAGTLARGVQGNIGRLPGMADTNFRAQSSRLGDYAIQAERKAASERREAIRSRLVNEGMPMAKVSKMYEAAVASGNVDEAAASLKHLSTTFGGTGRTEAARVLRGTNLASITDENQRKKMGTELDELIGSELYGSLVNSRVDIAKGGFRGGSSYKFSEVSKLAAPQLATQDGDVFTQATTRGEAVNADEAYLAMTNPDISGKITDTDTRAHLSSVSGVPIRQSGGTGPSGGGGTP